MHLGLEGYVKLTQVFVLDPYGRSPPFTPLGALGTGAFGGLGSPTLGESS